ncbi:hybrid sensor histidine kinase/response regulator [Noviherbaspirillum pedocola]|uniref:histidine kinase n=1 Tax=Noviherbaspirillum pedocola TaxID=2801341 RepID=A0A934W6V8_9BURK|nr:PAS domain S-box protein [Noviherbaspirillum pedocola]MBK4736647.1 PAS domain S-box protein [Noviherbaspirillum pedocola]
MTSNQSASPVPDHDGHPQAEERFRTLFEQAPFSVQLLAPDGRTLAVNRAWERLWSDEQHATQLKAQVLDGRFSLLADPQLEAKGITAWLRRAFAGESVTLPAICYDPVENGLSGRARWVKAWAHPIWDDAGQVREVMLVHEDITEQVQAEKALRDSERRFKQLANTIPQLAWIADASGDIHWYNERWYDYTGTTPEQMLGSGWQAVHDPAVLPAVLAQWRDVLARGEPAQMRFPLRGRDGSFRPFYTVLAPLKDDAGKVLQWFGTNTDISTLEQAQTALQRAEAWLQQGLLAGRMAVWEWDLKSGDVKFSADADSVFGYASATIEQIRQRVHPDDLVRLEQAVEQALATRGEFHETSRRIREDGSVIWIEQRGKLLIDAQGEPIAIHGVNVDVTDRVRAESELKEANRRKDEFLAMLAHELRNPLAPISAAAELLRLWPGDEARVRHASDIISRQVRHMTELVDDLLDVSRVTRGLIHLERLALDLKSVVSDAIEQARPLIEARRHRLLLAVDAAPTPVLGDRTRLIQVVVNVLANAAKYTPAGGEIALAVEVRADEANIIVSDNGCGIGADLLPLLFELFTQAKRTPDRSQGGLGIGLALVRSLVQLHGGRVSAHSEGRNRGSRFTVTLPLCRDLALPRREEASLFPVSPKRILLVDDNADAAQLLGALLETDGHRVTICDSAADALNALNALNILDASPADAPQVCILDIGLPDMSGHELARRLRAQPGMEAALFIALTGYGQPADRQKSESAGFNHHLVKPANLRELAAILASMD